MRVVVVGGRDVCVDRIKASSHLGLRRKLGELGGKRRGVVLISRKTSRWGDPDVSLEQPRERVGIFEPKTVRDRLHRAIAAAQQPRCFAEFGSRAAGAGTDAETMPESPD